MSLLTPREIADETRLGYRTVLRAIEDGELPAYKLRGQLRVRQEDYDEWLGASAVKPPAKTILREPSRTAVRVGSIPAHEHNTRSAGAR